jgi:PKD repeat protein
MMKCLSILGRATLVCIGGLLVAGFGSVPAALAAPPSFVGNIDEQAVQETELLSFSVSATDPDDDSITFGYSFGTEGLILTHTGPGTADIDWTPNCTQAGDYTLTLYAIAPAGIEGDFDTASVQVDITVVDVNCSPVFADISPKQVNEGNTLVFLVSATDPDGDSLALSMVTILPNAVFIDSSDGTGSFTFQPDYDQDSVYQVQFHASDGDSTANITAQVTVINVNGPPQLAEIADQSVRIEETLTFAVTATDPDGTIPVLMARPLPPAAVFSDDGDGSGQFAFTPTGAAPVSYTVRFIASDGQDADSAMVTISVLERPPEFGPDTLFVAKTGADTLGAGSRTAPYLTIQYALDHSDTGYVIVVYPGQYNEDVAYDIWPVELRSQSGAGATIINGNGKGTPVTFPPLPAGPPGVEVLHSVLDGFTVTCPSCAELLHGGVVVAGGAPVIRNNMIIDNKLDTLTTPSLGGGMYLISSSPVIYNNIIAGNTALAGGGVYIDDNASPIMINNTIAENASGNANAGAGIHIAPLADLHIKNSIIASNRVGWGLQSDPGNNARVSYSLFHNNDAGAYPATGLTIGESVISADPGFVDPAAGDYHLICNAGAYNKGDIYAIDTLTKTDLEGHLRSAYLKPDLGALEFLDYDKHADFSASVTAGCDFLTVQFTNISTCIDELWQWDFGDGTTSAAKNPSHTYVSPGVYDVTLIARGDLDSDTLIRAGYIQVYDELTADFTTDSLFGCVPYTVPFAAEIDGLAEEYTWDFGDGNVSNQPSPIHVYTAAGKYAVTLTVSSPCDTITVIKEDFIWTQAKPAVAITSSHDPDSTIEGSVCNPLTVRFYTVSDDSISSYLWDFADNTTSIARDPVHVYQTAGTYSVRLIATGICGSTTVIRQAYITVHARPTITPTANKTTGCVPLTVTFNAAATGPVTSYLWLFGDGTSASGPSVSHTYSSIDTFYVKLIAVHECGTDTIPLAAPIVGQDRPIVAFTCPSGDAYVGDSVYFTDQSENLPSYWTWNFGDGELSHLAHPAHVYQSPGIYTVSLTAGNSCGVGTQVEKQACVIVGSYEFTVGNPSVAGDTTFYSLDLDTVLTAYPNTIYLRAQVQPTPERGKLTTVFSGSSGVPPFTSRVAVIPSHDLASELYTITISAIDSVFKYQINKTIVFNHQGQTFLSLRPDTLNFDSAVVNKTVYLPVEIINTSPTEMLTALSVTAAGDGFSAPTIIDVPVLPDSSISFSVGFRPRRRAEYAGVLNIVTDDPAVRDTMIVLLGRGIPEQAAPTVTRTYPSPGDNDILISDSVVLEFSEPVKVDNTDTTMVISSRRLGWRLEGAWTATNSLLTFYGAELWPPLDTLDVRLVADRVYDSVYNTVDGDGDGAEERSPADDFVFHFVTGPGVFPGDTDDDGAADERDVLPIGRYWLQTGPPRPADYVDFSRQPAYAWADVAATYADADGDGVIDSLDVCPILEFWTDAQQAKPASQQRLLQELAALDAGILRAIYSAIDYCPATAAGAALKTILAGWLEQGSGTPQDFALAQNYPNPFNARTVITFTLPVASSAELVIFNVRGEKVAVIASGHLSAGRHVVVWDGRSTDGVCAGSGLYFCRLAAGNFRQTRKMVLAK